MSNLLLQLADPDEVAAIVDDVRREARYVVTEFRRTGGFEISR